MAKSFLQLLQPLLVTVSLLLPTWAPASPAELTVGIVPQQSATALATAWIPLLAELSARSGIRLAFLTAPDIPAFEERLQAGEYDLAYMNPYHYTAFSKTPGYRAFAREKERRLVGIVVVARDSPFRELKDLAGRMVAFPAPAAFAASILPRAEFSRQGVDIQPRYVNSHDSVYRGVALGTFAAGGGIRRTLEAMDPEIAGRLRILASTPPYVPHAFAAHPRVPAAEVERLTAAMLALGNDEAGRRLLEPHSIKGFEAGVDRDWDEIRRLRIDLPVGRTKPATVRP